jgi:phage tail sheath gpL-like
MGLTTIQVEDAWTNQAMKLITDYQQGVLSTSDDGE